MPRAPQDLDLTSVYAKLDRAEEHFKLADAEIDAWMKSGNNTFTIERGAYDTRLGIVVHFKGPEPKFLRWTLMIADCINNLRCALDHLVYCIAKHQTAKDPSADIDKLAFIIVDSPETFRDRNNRKRLKHLSSGVVDAIESVQPYLRTHPVRPPLLEILREFSNADKHRLLQMANAAMSIVRAEFIADDTRGTKSFAINPDPVKDNDVVCLVISSEPDPNLALHSCNAAMEVCLWHGLRKGETNPLESRTGYSMLIPMLISEVKFVVEHVRSAVV